MYFETEVSLTETPPRQRPPPLVMWPVVYAGTETPPSWSELQTGVKTLPRPKLRLRAVKISGIKIFTRWLFHSKSKGASVRGREGARAWEQHHPHHSDSVTLLPFLSPFCTFALCPFILSSFNALPFHSLPFFSRAPFREDARDTPLRSQEVTVMDTVHALGHS